MTWECPRCDRRYPDSAIGVPLDADADQKNGCKKCMMTIPESRLYEIYSTLADATEAAASGNPNGCASLAKQAKERVKDLHSEFDE